MRRAGLATGLISNRANDEILVCDRLMEAIEMEREIDWQRAVATSLADIVRMYDAAPFTGDLAPEHGVPPFALRASLLHFGMEQGMKALVKRYKPDTSNKEMRDIGHSLHRAYKALDPNARCSLDDCFEDARCFYEIKPAGQWKHLKDLEQYLQAIGSEKQFEDYRYWALDKDEWFRHRPLMELRIARELVRFIGDDLGNFGRAIGGPFFLSERLERLLQDCLMSHTIPINWGEDDIQQHYQDAFRLREKAGSWLQVLEKAVRDEFVGREGVQFLLRRQYDTFCDAKETQSDPAFRHALERMTAVRSRLSSSLKADLDEKGGWLFIRAPGRDLLVGDCIRRSDGRWRVIVPFYGAELAADRQSAIDLVIKRGTEEIYVQVNDDKPRKHRIVGSLHLPSGIHEIAEGCNLSDPEESIDFWDPPDWLPVGASVKLWRLFGGGDPWYESSTAVVLKVEDCKATLQFDEVPMFRMGKPYFLAEDENAT